MTKFKTNIPKDFGNEYKDKYCYTPVYDEEQGYRVAKVTYNETGYRPLGKANPNDPHELDKFCGTYEHCRQICDNFNKHINVSRDLEKKLVWLSMELQKDLEGFQIEVVAGPQ